MVKQINKKLKLKIMILLYLKIKFKLKKKKMVKIRKLKTIFEGFFFFGLKYKYLFNNSKIGVDYFSKIEKKNKIYSKILLKKHQFMNLFLLVKNYIPKNYHLNRKNTFFLVLIFLKHYPKYDDIEDKFKISKSEISNIINTTLPIISDVLKRIFIHNNYITEKSSILSNKIKYVIDAVYIKILKPKKNQKIYFRSGSKYGHHGINNHIIINYDGYITAFLINIPGSFPDGCIRFYVFLIFNF
jgi:hypothetical protein